MQSHEKSFFQATWHLLGITIVVHIAPACFQFPFPVRVPLVLRFRTVLEPFKAVLHKWMDDLFWIGNKVVTYDFCRFKLERLKWWRWRTDWWGNADFMQRPWRTYLHFKYCKSHWQFTDPHFPLLHHHLPKCPHCNMRLEVEGSAEEYCGVDKNIT